VPPHACLGFERDQEKNCNAARKPGLQQCANENICNAFMQMDRAGYVWLTCFGEFNFQNTLTKHTPG
jgi:hypothetical protein